MATTSHPEFNANTEGSEVVKAFADIIKGKTIVITGVNREGLGFSTAEALVSSFHFQIRHYHQQIAGISSSSQPRLRES